MKEKIANLEYYLKMHKKHPKQRFFIPLADLYNRFGYADEAVQVLKEGLKWHPNYLVARALLARILEDQGHTLQAHLEAEKVVHGDQDNLLGLQTFLKTSEKLKERKGGLIPGDPPIKSGDDKKSPDFKIEKLEKLLTHVQLRSHRHEISS